VGDGVGRAEWGGDTGTPEGSANFGSSNVNILEPIKVRTRPPTSSYRVGQGRVNLEYQ
jgi:hypothetical protein